MVAQKENMTQWVTICDQRVFSADTESEAARIISLPNPRTGKQSRYIVAGNGTAIAELKAFSPADRSSFFLGDSIQADGTIYFGTYIDPVFLLLPLLQNVSGKSVYMTLDQIVSTSTECAAFHHILNCSGVEGLRQICDVQEVGDIVAYRLSVDKTEAWLKAKTLRLADALHKGGTHVKTGSQSAVLSLAPVGTYTDDHIRYALGMMAEYLPADTWQSLCTSLNITMSVPAEAPALTGAPQKRKSEGPLEDYSLLNKASASDKASSKSKMTIAQKKLAQANTSGMKRISSFFGSKS